MDDALQIITDEIKKRLAGTNPQSPEPQAVYAQILERLDCALRAHTQGLPAPVSISSSQIDVIVTDEGTGRVFRRRLPLDYFENDNGITLSGENSNGDPVNLVLLSGTAIEKIRELRGLGPDRPRCHE